MVEGRWQVLGFRFQGRGKRKGAHSVMSAPLRLLNNNSNNGYCVMVLAALRIRSAMSYKACCNFCFSASVKPPTPPLPSRPCSLWYIHEDDLPKYSFDTLPHDTSATISSNRCSIVCSCSIVIYFKMSQRARVINSKNAKMSSAEMRKVMLYSSPSFIWKMFLMCFNNFIVTKIFYTFALFLKSRRAFAPPPFQRLLQEGC